MSASSLLFDSHCHLQDSRLDDQLNTILRNAKNNQIMEFLCCGTCEKDWNQVQNICSLHREIIPAFGLHPWYLQNRSDRWLETLKNMLTNAPSSIVGEIGLDHATENRNDIEQRDVFMAQLQLAIELDRPVSMHCRKAWDTLLDCLKITKKPPRGFAIHSYSGSVELIEPLVEYGAYFSFSGSVTFHRNHRAHKACVAVPDDRLLIETDTPDIMPVIDPPQSAGAPVNRLLNEPANLVYIARKAAALRNVSFDQIVDLTTQNARRLFGNREQT